MRRRLGRKRCRRAIFENSSDAEAGSETKTPTFDGRTLTRSYLSIIAATAMILPSLPCTAFTEICSLTIAPLL